MAGRRWPGFALFALSVLALLGTSRARWNKSAALVGPPTAASGRALSVLITASSEPRIFGSGVPSTGFGSDELPCLSPSLSGARMTCLLPPGAIISDVRIDGTCGGCTGPCVPPPGAFVTAKSAEVDAWKASVTSKLVTRLPNHASTSLATSVKVTTSGAEYATITLEATAVAGGPAVFREEHSARSEHGPPGEASAYFLIEDAVLGAPGDYSLVATATGWGRCASSSCIAPATLRLVGTAVVR